MTKATKVLLVGHCGFDSGSLHSLVRTAGGNLPVVMVNSQEELNQHATADTLLLVNRVLDGVFDAEDGIDLIEKLAKSEPKPAMMLVSNYADAQASAVEAGALPGFGKSQVRDAAVVARVREAIGQ